MKTQPEIHAQKLQSSQWHWPIDIEKYDRSPSLTDAERAELNTVVNPSQKWSAQTQKVLERLLRPLHDAIEVTGAKDKAVYGVLHVIFYEMHRRQTTFWVWTQKDWTEIFCTTQNIFSNSYKVPKDCRQHMMVIICLLCGFTDFHANTTKLSQNLLAVKIFGSASVDIAIQRVREEAFRLGYSLQEGQTRRLKNGQHPSCDYELRNVLCESLLVNRSPYLEDLTVEFLDTLRGQVVATHTRGSFTTLSHVLVGLGIINQPLKRWNRGTERYGNDNACTGVPDIWQDWSKRWYNTSTLAHTSRQSILYSLFKIGRWLAQEYPDVVNPEQWTRELAAECVAAVDRMLAGEWVGTNNRKIYPYPEKIGKPLSPRTKDATLSALRTFFQDCQEWDWIPRRFNPQRVLATPRSVRTLIGPAPRVIADDIWAKLLWAGLNLTSDDLPVFNLRGGSESELPIPTSYYPLEMVRAIVIVWLFAGLRSDEIYRLAVGCVRWQKNDVILPGTNEVVFKDAICYLDVPVNKTSPAYTKPVDRVVGEAITQWEQLRPDQAPRVDRKTGDLVHFLFSYRGKGVGETYLNDSIIPMLCKKAGAPKTDVRGGITSHRTRSTIASQLCNAREPMSLFELKEWLGHRHISSTINYTKVSPTKLAKSYADADYFKRNVRTIEVLIDRDAIQSGAAAAGEPYIYYDLGHGYCTYEFFSECKQRMICAGCQFHKPKKSSFVQWLEAKAHNQRMLQEISLTDDEQKVVEGDLTVMNKLIQELNDVPTPSGPTPRQLREINESNQPN